MFGIALFHRRKTEADIVVDLEQFLRSASAIVNEALTSAPEIAPSDPPPLDLDERLDEALWETFPASDPIAVSQTELAPAAC